MSWIIQYSGFHKGTFTNYLWLNRFDARGCGYYADKAKAIRFKDKAIAEKVISEIKERRIGVAERRAMAGLSNLDPLILEVLYYED